VTKVTISFTLDSERDRRILHYLEGLPKGEKSGAIREALDARLGGGSVTLGDVFQAVKDLDRKVGNGFLLVQTGDSGGAFQVTADEPADVAANLNALGL